MQTDVARIVGQVGQRRAPQKPIRGALSHSLQSLSPLQSEAVDSQAERRKIRHSVYIYALFWLVSCARSDSRIKMGFLFRYHG